MSGPYQRRDLSNCGAGRLLRVAINCGVLSFNGKKNIILAGVSIQKSSVSTVDLGMAPKCLEVPLHNLSNKIVLAQ